MKQRLLLITCLLAFFSVSVTAVSAKADTNCVGTELEASSFFQEVRMQALLSMTNNKSGFLFMSIECRNRAQSAYNFAFTQEYRNSHDLDRAKNAGDNARSYVYFMCEVFG